MRLEAGGAEATQSDDLPFDVELTTESLGAALDAFAATLSERDRRVLVALLLRSVDPVDRVRLLNPELLTGEQKALLAAIEAET